ncbi:MAG: hypothetical protein Ta2G_21610 [Termitinemataceae bacterium]|nr:MAG: hypothetical protein Ta2G_21610 [Termitinemataceae bacterium]
MTLETLRLSSAMPWIAMSLNLFPGFGVGSFLQGDKRAGVAGILSEVSGIGVMAVGILWRKSLAFDLDAPSYTAATVVTFAGFIAAAMSVLYQLTAPIIYYEKHYKRNNEAYKAYTKRTRLSCDFFLDDDGRTGLKIALKFSLQAPTHRAGQADFFLVKLPL